MLPLLTISVENLEAYNNIVWQFALCTFNLPDLPTKSACEKTINLYIFANFCSRWKPKYVNAAKTFLSIYSVHISFPTFNIKMIEFCTLKIVSSTISKTLLGISKKYFSIPCFLRYVSCL